MFLLAGIGKDIGKNKKQKGNTEAVEPVPTVIDEPEIIPTEMDDTNEEIVENAEAEEEATTTQATNTTKVEENCEFLNRENFSFLG